MNDEIMQLMESMGDIVRSIGKLQQSIQINNNRLNELNKRIEKLEVQDE